MKYVPNITPFAKTIREIAIPDIGEILVSFCVAITIYGLVSMDYLIGKLSGLNPELKNYSYDTLRNFMNDFSNAPNLDDASVMIVWGLIGAVLYIIGVTLLNFVIKARNNAVVNSYAGKNPEVQALSLFNEYRRVIWIFLLIMLLTITATKLLPIWLNSFDAFNQDNNFVFMIIGLAGLSINLYFIYSIFLAMWRNPTLLK